MKGYVKKALAALICVMLLSGCSDWERQQPIFQNDEANSEEQPVFLPQEEAPLETEELERPEIVSVAVTSTTDSENIWKTDDDVLSQSIYDALQIKNEEYEVLDIRPYDFDVTFTTKEEETISYGIWINFLKNNNVIVQDANGALWDIPVYDSNRLRIVLEALK